MKILVICDNFNNGYKLSQFIKNHKHFNETKLNIFVNFKNEKLEEKQLKDMQNNDLIISTFESFLNYHNNFENLIPIIEDIKIIELKKFEEIKQNKLSVSFEDRLSKLPKQMYISNNHLIIFNNFLFPSVIENENKLNKLRSNIICNFLELNCQLLKK